MSDLVVGKVNKVSSGQKFYSWPEFDTRVSRLEAKVKEQEVLISEFTQEIEDLAVLVQTLTKKHNQHLDFGHVNNKPQVAKESKKNE